MFAVKKNLKWANFFYWNLHSITFLIQMKIISRNIWTLLVWSNKSWLNLKVPKFFIQFFKNFGYQYDLIFPPFLITAVLFMNVIILVFQTTFGQMVTIPYTLFGFPLLTMFLGLYFKLQAMACGRGSQPENRINIKLQSSAISCDISW